MDYRVNEGAVFKTSNDPFSFKIKSIPKVVLNENLNLIYEETFFLCFGLDCLDVYDANTDANKCMSIVELWQKFISLDEDFSFKYAVYHKLRSKGWIIKYGIKYGCDFLVYYEGPDRYHASYSVKIKTKDISILSQELDQELCIDTDEIERFTQFSSLVRINETASKELLMCYVIYESKNIDFSNPNCLKKLSVLETFVNRWVPQEKREDKPVQINNTTNNQKNFYEYLKSFDTYDDDD